MIPILGMHRSGTSALAGALHKLGADLGPESAWIAPAADNPRGFFEFEQVVETNREVLATLGGTWSSPPPFPAGWVTSDELEEHRERARQIVAGMSPTMLVKDPRLSLVQPLWDHVSTPRPGILCVRHPSAVVQSLHRRNGFTVDQGLYLWFRYNAAALLNRPDSLVISYEQLLEDPEPVLRRLAAHIGIEASSAMVESAASSVQVDMAHHDSAPLPASPIGEICEALEGLLESDRRLDSDSELFRWARLVTELPWAGPSDREIALAQHGSRLLETEISRLQVDNRSLTKRIERLETELRHALSAVDSVSIAGATDLVGGTRARAR